MGRDAEEWNEVVERLRQVPEAERWQSEDVARLYMIAVKVAPGWLRGFELPTGLAEDLAADLLAQKLNQLIDCTGRAFAFLLVSLENRAKSWKRHQGVKARYQATRAASDAPVSDEPDRGQPDDEALKALGLLNAKEREIFVSLGREESREDIAKRLGTSRANIDQIISRARKRLAAKGLP